MDGFSSIQPSSLDDDLAPEVGSRVVSRDVQAQSLFPFPLSSYGARSGIIEVEYTCSAPLSGPFEVTVIEKDTPYFSPVMVWYVGGKQTPAGSPSFNYNQASDLLSTTREAYSAIGDLSITGTLINGQALASYGVQVDDEGHRITVTVYGQDAGVTDAFVGYFYYIIFFPENKLKSLDLIPQAV